MPAYLLNRRVRELEIAGCVHEVAVGRGSSTLLPVAETIFYWGDRVFLAVHAATADRIKTLLSFGMHRVSVIETDREAIARVNVP